MTYVFNPGNRLDTAEGKKIYALYEIGFTLVDVMAALSFLTGSILFFWDDTQTAAVWLFLTGSLFFTAKPVIRLGREVHLYRAGYTDELARQESV